MEIATQNQMEIRHVKEHQDEMRADVKGLRGDLDRLWSDTSELAEGVQ